MSVSMRARVCAPTPDLPLITLETVGTDTPARSAMNAMVTVPYGSPPATRCARPGRPTDPLPGTGKVGLPSMLRRQPCSYIEMPQHDRSEPGTGSSETFLRRLARVGRFVRIHDL